MLNFGAFKSKVKGGPAPRAPLDPRLLNLTGTSTFEFLSFVTSTKEFKSEKGT